MENCWRDKVVPKVAFSSKWLKSTTQVREVLAFGDNIQRRTNCLGSGKDLKCKSWKIRNVMSRNIIQFPVLLLIVLKYPIPDESFGARILLTCFWDIANSVETQSSLERLDNKTACVPAPFCSLIENSLSPYQANYLLCRRGPTSTICCK